MTNWIQTFLLAAFIVISSTTGRANLGDTVDQSVARYGKWISPKVLPEQNPDSPYVLRFRKDAFDIHEIFVKGLVENEYLKKSPPSAFTEKEKDQIFQSEGGEWSRFLADKKLMLWHRKDGAMASYNIESNTFIFFSKDFIEDGKH